MWCGHVRKTSENGHWGRQLGDGGDVAVCSHGGQCGRCPLVLHSGAGLSGADPPVFPVASGGECGVGPTDVSGAGAPAADSGRGDAGWTEGCPAGSRALHSCAAPGRRAGLAAQEMRHGGGAAVRSSGLALCGGGGGGACPPEWEAQRRFGPEQHILGPDGVQPHAADRVCLRPRGGRGGPSFGGGAAAEHPAGGAGLGAHRSGHGAADPIGCRGDFGAHSAAHRLWHCVFEGAQLLFHLHLRYCGGHAPIFCRL